MRSICTVIVAVNLSGIVGRSVMFRHRRTIELVLFGWVAAPQLDAVGPRGPWFRHNHAQQRLVRYAVTGPILDSLRRHNVLAVSDSDLPLTLACVVRLPHALLVPASAAATAIVPRPVRLSERFGIFGLGLLSSIVQFLFSILEHLLTP